MEDTQSESPPERPDHEADELEQALYECLEQMEESGPAAIEEVARRRPAVSEQLRQRMRVLQRAGLLETPRAAAFPARLGEFVLLRPLGSGGMGSVHLARQESLNREVALKVVRADLLFFPSARERFRREAEVLSQLRHPGIVPVHAVGEQDGVPYLAMEHVRGATLAEILHELEGRDVGELQGADLVAALGRALAKKGLPMGDAESAAFSGSWHRVCVQLVEQVALALEHAHRQGVLHRDIKPSNVMLSADGRTRLFDFGLATTQGTAQLTVPGTPIGTLPYMAPEQLAGGALDGRTDVYGLGVVLHELLTLHHAFDGKSETELRAQILSGTPASLRRRAPDTPPDVESVCMKALDRDPARRYASAAELARDLRNLLELRPVSARPLGRWMRVRRMAARRPAHALALALLALIVVGGPLGYALQRDAAARRIEAALESARTESARAELNFDRALDAVVHMLGEVADDELAEIPGMGPVRARLFERSLRMLDELMPQRAGDPALDLQRALLLRESANLLDLLGREDEAISAYEESVALLRERARRGHREDRLDLARAIGNLAKAHHNDGRFEAALEHGREVIELLGSDGEPSDVEGLSALWLAHRNRADTLALLERFEPALAELELAVGCARRLCELDDSPSSGFALAHTYSTLGLLLQRRGDSAGAMEAYEHALPLLDELTDAPRPEQEHLKALGSACTNYSILLGHDDRYEEQEIVARAGLEAYERLVHEHPYIAHYRWLLGNALEALGIALAGCDRLAEALPNFQECVRVRAREAALDPADRELAELLAQAHSNLANASLDLGLVDEARAASAEAVAGFDRLLAEPRAGDDMGESSVFARLLHEQVLLSSGEYPDAARLDELVRARADRSARAFMALAILMSAALECARTDPTLDAAARAAREHEFRERALSYLEEALGLGYASAARIASTREFDVLRDDPAFQQLVDRLR